ncbi:universal stress protein [Amycolatopsis sp. NPDC059657]|uniref:universal stress protein n=1 Tax=Amycolatopsis sp. NPDC059657 TaxID=3346899 RepID=UPI0036734FDB
MTRETIVAGVDGSGLSRAAVKWAAKEARLRDAELRLVHACAFPESELAQRQARLGSGEEMLLDICCQALADARRAAREAEPGIDVVAELKAGLTAKVLIGESATAGTLVVGAHRTGALRGLALGSVAAAVAVRSSCPVVIVHASFPESGPVVLGVDLALDDPVHWEYAFEAASRRDTPLLVVYAEPGRGAAAARQLEARLAGWSAKYPDVNAECRVVPDHNPARALVTAGAAAQLIVIGSRGRGQVTAAVLGSTGASLLRRASCPVAIVHHEAERIDHAVRY